MTSFPRDRVPTPEGGGAAGAPAIDILESVSPTFRSLRLACIGPALRHPLRVHGVVLLPWRANPGEKGPVIVDFGLGHRLLGLNLRFCNNLPPVAAVGQVGLRQPV